MVGFTGVDILKIARSRDRQTIAAAELAKCAVFADTDRFATKK